MNNYTRWGEMKRLIDRCRILGVMVLLWVIEVILIDFQATVTPNYDEDVTTSAQEYVEEIDTTYQSADIQPVGIVQVAQPAVEVATEDTSVEIVTELESEREEETTTQQVSCYIDLSYEEVYTLACLVWLEGRGESIECQEAIASVVVNRYTAEPEKYNSMFDVIYAKNQFSPADMISSTTPKQLQLDIVSKIVTEGPTIPEYVTYFRADYYHQWPGQVPYCQFDTTYFSYDEKLKKRLEGVVK